MINKSFIQVLLLVLFKLLTISFPTPFTHKKYKRQITELQTTDSYGKNPGPYYRLYEVGTDSYFYEDRYESKIWGNFAIYIVTFNGVDRPVCMGLWWRVGQYDYNICSFNKKDNCKLKVKCSGRASNSFIYYEAHLLHNYKNSTNNMYKCKTPTLCISKIDNHQSSTSYNIGFMPLVCGFLGKFEDLVSGNNDIDFYRWGYSNDKTTKIVYEPSSQGTTGYVGGFTPLIYFPTCHCNLHQGSFANSDGLSYIFFYE